MLLFEALDRVLPTEDADISKVAARALAKQNIDDPHRHAASRTSRAPTTRSSFSFGDEKAEVDWFIIAAGRGPDIEGLGLDEAGVKLDDNGLIEVDGALRTSVKGVYAIGDLVPGPGARAQGVRRGRHRGRGRGRARDAPDRVHRHPARHVLHAERRLASG